MQHSLHYPEFHRLPTLELRNTVIPLHIASWPVRGGPELGLTVVAASRCRNSMYAALRAPSVDHLPSHSC